MNTSVNVVNLNKSSKEHGQSLQDLSFQIKKGEVVGIVGFNDSGKSILSKILANQTKPTTGSVFVEGKTIRVSLSNMLEPQLTGRENIQLACVKQGFSKEKVQQVEQKVIDFIDKASFIDKPVNFYSFGDKVQLALSISLFSNPDLLIIDEAIAATNATFVERYINEIHKLKTNETSVVLVTHSFKIIKQACDRVLWLDAGKIIMFDATENVLPLWEKEVQNRINFEKQKNKK